MKPMMLVPGVPGAGHLSRGFWHPGPIDGCVKCSPPGPRLRIIRSSDVARCPRRILGADHYRADGTCRCASQRSDHAQKAQEGEASDRR